MPSDSATRQVQVGVIKSIFDDRIDRHAEAYQAAYEEVKEFSSFGKSGTFKYYIGMVWTSDNEKPDTQQLRIRGSQTLAKNKLLELDLNSIDSQQCFFPGQIVAFLADPFLKERLTVKKFLDPMRIAPQMKAINTDDQINLVIASGPFMKPERQDWTLFDNLIASIKENQATHVVLIGPFVDIENKSMRTNYDTNWRLIIDKLVEGLHKQNCNIYLVPSGRDLLDSNMATSYTYPSPTFDFKLNLKNGVRPSCTITSVSDPAQIDLGGIYLDVTSAEVLFHLNKCTSFIERGPGNTFHALYRHLLSHGIYPMYPSPSDIATDHQKLDKHLSLDRLGPHLLVLPTKFNTSVNEVDNRLVVTVQKCCTKRHMVLIEIPKIESSGEFPINSLILSKYSHRIIDLCPQSAVDATPTKMIVDEEMAPVSSPLANEKASQQEVPAKV